MTSLPFVLPDQLAVDCGLDEARAFYAGLFVRWHEHMDGTVAITGTLAERRTMLHSLLGAMLDRGLVRLPAGLDEIALVTACVTDEGTDAAGLAGMLATAWVR